MISPEELRIGNIIMNRNGQTSAVTSISPFRSEVITDCNGVLVTGNFSDINPVPINNDWLNKFGFLKRNSTMQTSYFNNFFELIDYGIQGHGLKLRLSIALHDLPIISKVHQLQNLYYAITGTELT